MAVRRWKHHDAHAEAMQEVLATSSMAAPRPMGGFIIVPHEVTTEDAKRLREQWMARYRRAPATVLPDTAHPQRR